MKRAAIVFGVLTLLLFADGIYLLATHTNPNGDTGVLFGNPNNFLSAGTVVVISALVLLVATVIMWLVAVRREDRERQAAERPPTSKQAAERPPTSKQAAERPPTGEQAGQSGRTASKA
jgi:Na+-transporting methylmalonyl-CoA/oxaloacetate decarboxylase gamma subunit